MLLLRCRFLFFLHDGLFGGTIFIRLSKGQTFKITVQFPHFPMSLDWLSGLYLHTGYILDDSHIGLGISSLLLRIQPILLFQFLGFCAAREYVSAG